MFFHNAVGHSREVSVALAMVKNCCVVGCTSRPGKDSNGRVRNEKIDINEINCTPNQHKEYHNLYIKQQNERRQILSFQGKN